MEFHEKLQELRKSKGLTQEELAQALYVSRTAVSKWEQGRGYPNIDSLKDISVYFSVSIDALLSGEKLLFLAEKESNTKIQSICGLLFGLVDMLYLMLIVLPLYPKTVDGYVYSVTLWNCSDAAAYNLLVYWLLFLALIACGLCRIIQTQLKTDKGKKTVAVLSFALGFGAVLYLVLTRQVYAATVAILLMLIKALLLFKSASPVL